MGLAPPPLPVNALNSIMRLAGIYLSTVFGSPAWRKKKTQRGEAKRRPWCGNEEGGMLSLGMQISTGVIQYTALYRALPGLPRTWY